MLSSKSYCQNCHCLKKVGNSATVWLILLMIVLPPTRLFGQEASAASIRIVGSDTNQFPQVELQLRTRKLAQETLDSLKVVEAGKEAQIESSQSEKTALQIGILIDPLLIEQEQREVGMPYAEVFYALHPLAEQEVFLRQQDQLSISTLQTNGQIGEIQPWTQEPNQAVNSIANDKDYAGILGEPPESAWSGFLIHFENAAPTRPLERVALIFTHSSRTLPDTFVKQARQREIALQIISMGEASGGTSQVEALRSAAEGSGGTYIDHGAADAQAQLIAAIENLRTLHRVVYRSNLTQNGPVAVEVTLDDGTIVEAQTELTVAADSPSADESANLPSPQLTNTANEEPANSAPGASENAAPIVANPGNFDPVAPAEVPGGAGWEQILIPGLNITIPKIVLQITLPVLLLVIVYLVFTDVRDRRTRGKDGARNGNDQAVFELRHAGDFALQNSSSRAQMGGGQPGADLSATPVQSPDPEPTSSDPLDNLQPLHPHRRRQPLPKPPETDELPAPAPRQEYRYFDEVDEDGEVTLTPGPRYGDDQATYRLPEEIELPIMGQLVRVTSDPKLPQSLPIYGYRSGYGDDRQIYVGRHSKNNTIVIGDKSISREHAVILQKSGRLYLRDNASTAGTFLNWKRLEPGQEMLLRHKDLIGFGEIMYEFQVHGEDEATVTEE